jgi:hypothetical protein
MQPANALNPFARSIFNLGENREFTTGLGNLFNGTNANIARGNAFMAGSDYSV